MKIFSILVFAVRGVSGLLSETSVRNDQQTPLYVFDGKVITNADEFAEVKLNHFAQLRGSSIDAFVQKFDFDFSVMYRCGLSNARDYLKAAWDCGKLAIRDGRVELDAILKDVFAKLGIQDAEFKATQAEEMRDRFVTSKARHFVMLESLLFILGTTPFAEYSAIYHAIIGTRPTESDFTREQLSCVISGLQVSKVYLRRLIQEKHCKRFSNRFNDFNLLFRRPAAGAPGPAPAAKRARQTEVGQDEGGLSVLADFCQHAKYEEEIASLKTELHAKNQRIDELSLRGWQAVAQLKSELQSKDQHYQQCQAELRAELQGKIDVLTAQNQQLQRENAGLRQHRPQKQEDQAGTL